MSLKISTKQVIVFDDAKYEAQEPVISIYKPGVKAELDENTMPLRWLLGYNFKAKTRDTYYRCEVKHQKGKEKKVIQGSFQAPGKDKGRVLHVKEQVENQAEAERLAKKKLREANKEAVTGNFSTIGNTNFAAGQVLKMVNFGHFDGNYLATKVVHEVAGGAGSYTTKVDVRRCLNGY
jgi:phage protein D